MPDVRDFLSKLTVIAEQAFVKALRLARRNVALSDALSNFGIIGKGASLAGSSSGKTSSILCRQSHGHCDHGSDFVIEAANCDKQPRHKISIAVLRLRYLRVAIS